MWRLLSGPGHKVRQSACISCPYFGAGLLTFESGRYLGDAIWGSMVCVAVADCCLVWECVAFFSLALISFLCLFCCFILFLSQMSFNSFCCRGIDLHDRGQKKQQQYERGTCSASIMSRTEG